MLAAFSLDDVHRLDKN